MKKLVTILAVLVVAISLQAQDFRSTLYPDITYRLNNVNAVVSDTSDYEVQWEVQSHYPFTYSLGLDIEAILGVPGKDTLYVHGRISNEDDWVSLGSVVPASNSMTIRLTNDTTGVRYRFIKALYTKTDTSQVRVNYHWLKIWRE